MKKYKCMNIGNCDFSNNGKEFEIAEGEELKCPKCGSDMIVEVRKAPIGKYAIIAAAVLAVIGGGVGATLMMGGGLKIDKVELTPSQIALVIGETPKAQLSAKVLDTEGKEMSDEKITLEWTIDNESVVSITQDGEVTAVGQGNATITVQVKGEEKSATCPVEVKIKEIPVDTVSVEEPDETEKPIIDKQTDSKPITPKQPSWGVYSGERDKKNGLPNGQGELRITRNHDINGETAQPGETIKGVFRNGYVNMGKWYKKDGNVVVVKDIKVL